MYLSFLAICSRIIYAGSREQVFFVFCHNPAYLIPQNCPGEITFFVCFAASHPAVTYWRGWQGKPFTDRGAQRHTNLCPRCEGCAERRILSTIILVSQRLRWGPATGTGILWDFSNTGHLSFPNSRERAPDNQRRKIWCSAFQEPPAPDVALLNKGKPVLGTLTGFRKSYYFTWTQLWTPPYYQLLLWHFNFEGRRRCVPAACLLPVGNKCSSTIPLELWMVTGSGWTKADVIKQCELKCFAEVGSKSSDPWLPIATTMHAMEQCKIQHLVSFPLLCQQWPLDVAPLFRICTYRVIFFPEKKSNSQEKKKNQKH